MATFFAKFVDSIFIKYMVNSEMVISKVIIFYP